MAFDSELPILLPHDAGDLDPKGARLTIGGQTIEVIAYALLLGRGAIHNSSLRRLNVFRTVVDCGGVNAAAEHLDISQPSVTAHLRALETQLGSRLFMRSRGRRNIITPTGQALYKYANYRFRAKWPLFLSILLQSQQVIDHLPNTVPTPL
ncbi:MAG: LysR family transcriptional regulator [Alphaproteobacteria bacterium]|nr:LysR family transcriptional regulator [Alphaproteobacteria bacterium]